MIGIRRLISEDKLEDLIYEEDQLLTPAQVRRAFALTDRQIGRMVHQGSLPYVVRAGSTHRRYLRSDVLAALNGPPGRHVNQGVAARAEGKS